MSNPQTKSGQALQKLREFGYAFNAAGELRQIDPSTKEAGAKPFEFEVYDDYTKNQEHYEKLADQVPEIVYDLLEQNGLSRTYVPEDIPAEEATFIFTYPEKLEKPEKLIVIIHGSGYVRAGQWARSLIINNSLDHGTQLPYIKKAKELGYAVLVTNTNDNYRLMNGTRKSIPGHNTATAHASYIWENYVMASQPEAVAIVAHSYGGAVTMDLAKRFPDFFKEKVFAIAFTDSVQSSVARIPASIRQTVADMTCNWVSSEKPLDAAEKTAANEVKSVSAGHAKHEWTSYAAIESVFKFLESQYAQFIGNKSKT